LYHPCREQYGSESAHEDVLLGKNQLGRELALAADRMQFFKKVSVDCADPCLSSRVHTERPLRVRSTCPKNRWCRRP
jgi:hypothetical protein